MKKFLTEEIFNFSKITLDYTYAYERNFGTISKYNISSTSNSYHFLILQEMIAKGLIYSDSQILEYLENRDVFIAAQYITTLADMIFYFSDLSVLYCPKNSHDYQLLRLRMWYEYLSLIKKEFSICLALDNRNFKDIEAQKEIALFLESKKILDDEYIRSICKKIPNYENRIIHG